MYGSSQDGRMRQLPCARPRHERQVLLDWGARVMLDRGTTMSGMQPPAPPITIDSVSFWVEGKSPGATRQKRCCIARRSCGTEVTAQVHVMHDVARVRGELQRCSTEGGIQKWQAL